MKIRIKGNSIRIRLTRSEVDNFSAGGYVEERTEFGNKALVYALKSTSDVQDLAAMFGNDTITMLVPAATAQAWAANDTVGYSNDMDLGNGKKLFLLLEKDFKCIDADVREDQSDNYENPLLSCE